MSLDSDIEKGTEILVIIVRYSTDGKYGVYLCHKQLSKQNRIQVLHVRIGLERYIYADRPLNWHHLGLYMAVPEQTRFSPSNFFLQLRIRSAGIYIRK